MYLLIISKDYIKRGLFHVFSTMDSIEEWLNEHYKYNIIPDYEIIEFNESKSSKKSG